MKTLRPYIPYIGALLALNVVLALAFEVIRPGRLSWDGLWNARTAVWAGLLLFDNLIVVWWYAHLTREVATSTRDAAHSATTQARISLEQQKESRRPCVVIEWQFTKRSVPHFPDGHTYIARNVGRGLALNVVYVEDLDATTVGDRLHIGALASDGYVELPPELVQQLNREAEQPIGRTRHVLIAEPVDGDEWIVTENLIERGGRLSHRTRSKKLSREQIGQIHRDTATEYIHRNWPAIQGELNAMLGELKSS